MGPRFRQATTFKNLPLTRKTHLDDQVRHGTIISLIERVSPWTVTNGHTHRLPRFFGRSIGVAVFLCLKQEPKPQRVARHEAFAKGVVINHDATPFAKPLRDVPHTSRFRFPLFSTGDSHG